MNAKRNAANATETKRHGMRGFTTGKKQNHKMIPLKQLKPNTMVCVDILQKMNQINKKNLLKDLQINLKNNSFILNIKQHL